MMRPFSRDAASGGIALLPVAMFGLLGFWGWHGSLVVRIVAGVLMFIVAALALFWPNRKKKI